MTSSHLQRLAHGGDLETEEPSRPQFLSLVRLGRSLLDDARGKPLSLEGRFSLVYHAAQVLASAALLAQGYRPGSRSAAFECLPETAGLSQVQSRVLALCHDRRLKAEQAGSLEIDERLVAEAAEVTQRLLERLERLRL